MSGAIILLVVSLLPVAAAAHSNSSCPCSSDVDCSLNGICTTHPSLACGVCACDKPWTGVSCGVLSYKANQSVSAKNLYPHNDTGAPKSGPCVTPSGSCDALNTWNGPIVGPVDGKFHMYNPLYKKGSLLSTQDLMHGIADKIEGPYSWTSLAGRDFGSNPAFVTYNDTTTGTTKYSLWCQKKVYLADSPYGPFSETAGGPADYNPAPLFHEGKFYMTSQGTGKVWTANVPGGPWTEFANITAHSKATREDPFMWIDTRGNWHIINHMYSTSEVSHCGSSSLSDHLFSEDGKTWRTLNVEPYSHTVSYEDGVQHTYTTLERPNCHFDATGRMTHINLAADMVTQDEGCAHYSTCPAKVGGSCACTNCKYADHAGTIIVALG